VPGTLVEDRSLIVPKLASRLSILQWLVSDIDLRTQKKPSC
jgi:hypothetical protein